MEIIMRDDVEKVRLPGRILQKVVGKDSRSASSRMTMGFAHYSDESGRMEPHRHAEEICYIVAVKNGWVRSGKSQDRLSNRTALSAGMTLHVGELEWHAFECDAGGFVDILFFYGQVDNIRPEDSPGR